MANFDKSRKFTKFIKIYIPEAFTCSRQHALEIVSRPRAGPQSTIPGSISGHCTFGGDGRERVKRVERTDRTGVVALFENPASASQRPVWQASVRYDEIYQRRRVTAGTSDTEKQSPTLDKIRRRYSIAYRARPFKPAGPRRVIGGGLAAFLDRADMGPVYGYGACLNPS